MVGHFKKEGVEFFRYEVEKYKKSKEQELESYKNSFSINTASWNTGAIADGKIEAPTGTTTRKSVKSVNT